MSEFPSRFDPQNTMGNTDNQPGLARRRELASYAVRGIGPYGQDVLATTTQAFDPADALAAILQTNPRLPVEARCWVVTKLG